MRNNFENMRGNSEQSAPNIAGANSQQNAGNTNSVDIPSISLPKGGGAISGIEDKFQVNAVTGTSSLGISIPLSPSRNSFMPGMGLSYDSGSGNSAFGLGWGLGVPSVSRKTQKELPQYQDEIESDTFIMSGTEDLVPVLTKGDDGWSKKIISRLEHGINYTIVRYRPRIEGGYTRIERWVRVSDGDTHWRAITAANVHSYYGLTDESRVSDPTDPTKVFEWKLCRSHNDKGSITIYEYKKEDFAGVIDRLSEKNRINNCTQLYLKKVCYGVKTSYYLGDDIPTEDNFLFKVVFDYGEHPTTMPIPKNINQEINDWTVRKDPFSSYKSGFEIRTYRRCHRVLMFHCFDAADLPHKPYLTKSLELFYDESISLESTGSTLEGFSFLVKSRHNGHLWDVHQNHYTTKHLPDFNINYQNHEWNTTIQKVSQESMVNAPVGVQDRQYLWIDLFSEGIAGILTEQSNGWFYKSNLGFGDFSRAKQVAPKPSFVGMSSGRVRIMELEGNGIKSLVQLNKEPKGYFKLTPEEEWEPFKTFRGLPNINLEDGNMRPIDLNGDGLTDLLITENNKLRWYPGAGEKGFEVSKTTYKAIDEEKGPAIVFKDQTQSIFLSDMSGDGLTDIVRIRNGEISYWPNLGHGHFGAKVTMENAPIFDSIDCYNSDFLRLADIDGSGTMDIVYLGNNDFRVWMNQNGNSWTTIPQIIDPFPDIDNLADVSVLDFLGSGTACIVYTSSHPKNIGSSIRYIDLMGSKKPHLMIGYENNTGKEVSIQYKSSTYFYLEDKKEGKNWITKLPFPVHCVWKTRSEDKIRKTIFTSSYRYCHGYFDSRDREYRGFARVEQLDTEDFNQFKINEAKNVVEEDLHQPPVKTISWFHTGAFINKETMLHQLKDEYFKNLLFTEYQIPEIEINDSLSTEELREATRAFKGLPLRVEVYAEDQTAQSEYPYSATGNAFMIKRIQPLQPNKHAVFQVISSENIAYTYERNPEDPKISHTMVLTTDELGNALQTASIIYPRMQRPIAPNAIPDMVWNEQNKLHVVYGETDYTNDILQDTVYRLRASYEARSYEVRGITQPQEFFITKGSMITQLSTANTISYEDEFIAGIQKRLSAQKRSYFFKDDLNGPLPLGELSKLGITHKRYALAFTRGLVTELYDMKVTDAMLVNAGYVHTEGDQHWWIQSGIQIYPVTPKDTFYMPIGTKDIFGNKNQVQYDSHNVLSVATINALGHQITAINDYRTLQAVQVTDSNQNRTTVETDPLGMVIKTAVMGKVTDNEGDTLANPTTRMEYDLMNWQVHQKPNYVHVFSRTQHDPDTPDWKEAYIYSDGGGSMIMTKKQAEPGIALQWNTTTQRLDKIVTNPRWIGNGRTIVNNKGSAIKRFDPYFSTTHEYEQESALVETGFSPIHYYDPLGRNIRIENPNGTFSKIEMDAWKFLHYDVNDTVISSEWYQNRGAPDPLSPEPAAPDQYAAWTAAKHDSTPTTRHMNNLGQVFYVVTDHGNGKITHTHILSDLMARYKKSYDQKERLLSEVRTNIVGKPVYSKSAEGGENWTFADALGRAIQKWDNDLKVMRMNFDEIHRPISTYITPKGLEEILFSHIVYGDILIDAEQRNLIGKPYQVFDQAGVITTQQLDFKGNVVVVERMLCKEYKKIINWKSLEGATNITDINSVATPSLENEIFTTSATYDALNRPVITILPDQTVIVPSYNEANMLESLQAQIRGQGNFITFLDQQDYNAKGQRQFVVLGNGITTEYFYDPRTFELINLVTKVAGDPDTQNLQNLKYTFDPLGNIVHYRDDAQQTHYFSNAVVTPEQRFEYDALYQLTKATGREHTGLIANTQRDHKALPFVNQLPHINNLSAIRTYTETYQYDDCGNILQLRHQATGGNWTRHYRYGYQDEPTDLTNRLHSTSLPGELSGGPYTATYQYDLHGNMIQMPHLNALEWDLMDRLKEVDLGGGGSAFYVYGTGHDRIRKIIERPGGKRIERIYLGSVEIYREYQGTDKKIERSTAYIDDDNGKIAQIDTKILDIDATDPANPLGLDLIRYQYGNHIGSAVLETDEVGTIISYEEYHPFGTSAYRSSKSTANLSLKRYRFSGKECDEETGLYYFGARYYAAWLGRWTSSDPGGYISGTNLYRYCANNPIMHHDPNGMDNGRVSRTAENKHLADPAQRAAAEAYLERVYTSRLRPQYADKQVDITQMDFDASTGRWIIGENGFRLIPRTEQGAPSTGSTPGGALGGSPDGDPQGSPDGVPDGSVDGATDGTPGSPDGVSGGNPEGSPDGSPGGSPNGSPGGSPTGSPGGSPDGSSGSGGDDGSFSFDGGSFLGGLLAGIAVGFLIAAIIITAPISIPASVAIGAGIAGGGLLAYSSVQSVRRRDMLNRPISNEQANHNLGFGLGGVVGGGLAGPTINGGNQMIRGGAQALGQFGGGGLVPAGAGGGSITISGATTTVGVISVPAGTVQAATGVTQGINIMMMEGSGNGGSGGDSPSNREFFDLDDAAEAALGEGAEMGSRIGDIGPVKSEGVMEALRSLGYNPNNFRAIQYNASGPKGNYILTVFENGGVYFGPHISSANF